MELIGPELSELSALELKYLPHLTLFFLASANIVQSVPNLATIYMPVKSQMSSIMGQIETEHPELFACKFGKLLNLTLFTLEHLQILTLSQTTDSRLLQTKRVCRRQFQV